MYLFSHCHGFVFCSCCYYTDFVLRSAAIWLPLAFFVLHTWFSAPDTAWNQDFTNAANATTTGANAATATTTNKPDIFFVQKIYRIATVVSAFAAAIGLSEGCTVMVKLWVKRRRPNFYALCGFNAATKTCNASVKHVREVSVFFFRFSYELDIVENIVGFLWWCLTYLQFFHLQTRRTNEQ